jgi:hypothetical protein
MTEEQKSLLRLVARSPDIGDGWRQVSDVLWTHVQKWAHPGLTEIDEGLKRIRLSPDGLIVMRYLP